MLVPLTISMPEGGEAATFADECRPFIGSWLTLGGREQRKHKALEKLFADGPQKLIKVNNHGRHVFLQHISWDVVGQHV